MGTGMSKKCTSLRLKLVAKAGLMATLASNQALASGATEPGLPQLDINTWPSQIFWLVVIFGFGYLVMAKIVTPKIGVVIEGRRERLDEDLGKARQASADAERIRAEYEAGLETARNEAAEFARKAAAEAAAKASAAEQKAASKLATKVAAAEKKLGEARGEALDNLNAVAAEAALDAVKSLTGLKATKAQAEKTVKSIAKAMAPQESN
jgi:F-type H+-transporting ATPase subunit b